MKRSTIIIVILAVCVVASAMTVSAAIQPQLTRDSSGTYHYGSAVITASATRPATLAPGNYRRVIIGLDGGITYLDIQGPFVPYEVTDKIRLEYHTAEARTVL